MKQFNYICSVLLTIALVFMVFFMSSTIVIHLPSTYQYHFNDGQTMGKIKYDIAGSDISKEIASYLIPFKKDKFQIYEDNGIYQDPVFKTKEQSAMKKARKIVNMELVLGLFSTAIFASVYAYLYKQRFKEAIRNRYRLGAILGIILLFIRTILFLNKGFRIWAYNYFIGINLGKNSTLSIILGDPFYKTYIIFSMLLGIIMFSILTYVNHKITKPERIFY